MLPNFSNNHVKMFTINLFNQNYNVTSTLVDFIDHFLRDFAISRDYILASLVMIYESDILVKSFEYQSNWTRITKIKQELLNMGLGNISVWPAYFCLPFAIIIMSTKTAGSG